MQQYWINQDGVQAGPVTIEQMEKMSITGKAYVWRSGLEDWVKITELPELAGVLQSPSQNVPPVPPVTPPSIPEALVETEVPSTEPESEAEATVEPEQEQEVGSEPEEATTDDTVEAQAATDDLANPQPPEIPSEYYGSQPLSTGTQEAECPPSNLAWAIVSVFLCQPLGIVAIILSILVKSSFRDGNTARANKLSEWSAWCCILAITLGVASYLFLPLELLL